MAGASITSYVTERQNEDSKSHPRRPLQLSLPHDTTVATVRSTSTLTATNRLPLEILTGLVSEDPLGGSVLLVHSPISVPAA